MKNPIQFWDTSALISLVFEELHTPLAKHAAGKCKIYWAWDWMQIEASATLYRRKGDSGHSAMLTTLQSKFEFIKIDPSSDYPNLLKLLEKYRLRSADAGHLFCLLQTQKLYADIEFVCFDRELVSAAEKEGVRVFS